jgi:hypothetical protein
MQNIAGTLKYYEKELGASQAQVYRQLLSAFRHFLMPGWGFPRPPKRSTQEDMAKATYALEQLPLERLYNWEIAIEKGFDLADKDARQRSVPRSHVRKFYNWCLEKGILIDPTQHEKLSKTTPALKMGEGSNRPKTRRNKVDMSHYSLKEKQISPSLWQEFDKYRAFIIEPLYRKRVKKRKRESTANIHYRIHKEILGWLHNHCGILLEDLSLDLIVRSTDIDDQKDAEKAAEEFRVLIFELAKFLQSRGTTAGSVAKKINVLTQLIQFQYLGQFHHRHGNDIPVMKVARELAAYYEDCASQELDPILLELKWLELPEVIQKIALPAFKYTEYKTKDKVLRSLSAIADSFQTALKWSFIALMPPRRPGEWRTCKLAMACELSEKPRDLQPGEWIWPLPPNRMSAEELKYGYLTRQYVFQDPQTKEKFGAYLGRTPPTDRYLERIPLWFKDTPPLAAKSGESHGYQHVLIMDRRVYRDKHLYDFLEAYVMGYWRDRYGNWISAGKSIERPNSSFRFHELHSHLLADTSERVESGELVQPSTWLFVGSRTGKLVRCGDFGDKFGRFAYKMTGQFLTPHLMRSVYAVHLLETVGDRATLISLAEAMGHKIKTLEQIYDKRRPGQKTRLIEVELSSQLDRICSGLPVDLKMPQQDSSFDAASLKAAIQQLSPRERKLLLESFS